MEFLRLKKLKSLMGISASSEDRLYWSAVLLSSRLSQDRHSVETRYGEFAVARFQDLSFAIERELHFRRFLLHAKFDRLAPRFVGCWNCQE